MVSEIDACAIATTRSLRAYCWRHRRIVEILPGHPKWGDVVAVVRAASRCPVCPSWVRFSEHGITWSIPEGIFGHIAWSEFREDYSTDWNEVRKGGARAAILTARRHRKHDPGQGDLFDGR
jgi:hypothetical protein